jgi:hypothetical protein
MRGNTSDTVVPDRCEGNDAQFDSNRSAAWGICLKPPTRRVTMRYPQPSNPNAAGSGIHHETPSAAMVEAIAVTAEVCGLALSHAAAEMLAGDLAEFEERAVFAALSRCRMELRGTLRLPDILARIDDGRPSVEEAWAMMPKSELASVVWTDEMAQAWGVAWPMLNQGDVVGARLAFREAYAKAVLDARIHHEAVRWIPSLGSDVAAREGVLRDAVEKRRLTPEHMEKLLPSGTATPQAEEIFEKLKLKSFH